VGLRLTGKFKMVILFYISDGFAMITITIEQWLVAKKNPPKTYGGNEKPAEAHEKI